MDGQMARWVHPLPLDDTFIHLWAGIAQLAAVGIGKPAILGKLYR
jgi:hypothetical protein